jgi:arsenate reductase (thioredoxin)
MAEAYLNHKFGDRYLAHSAGTDPRGVNPHAVAIMEEIGVEMMDHRSMHVNEFIEDGTDFDLVATVCDDANENCPYFPGGKNRIHRSFPDPSRAKGNDDESLQEFRNVRNMLINWIENEF